MNEQRRLGLPEENLLYFLEKHAPKLEDWQASCLRIVRLLSQYFYPQRQTKMMNEGCATFVHYEIMNRLYERGLVDRRHHAGVPALAFLGHLSSPPSMIAALAASIPTRSALP